jgi:ABC-2 type transport system ATP-binding protein
MADAVRVSGLTKSFGGFIALAGLALSVDKGKIFGLLGPNGAGKTTLIKVLCGLMRPTSGEARVLDSEPDAVSARIGYMPQESALYLDMTARENMRFFGRLYGIAEGTMRKREEELLKLVGLEAWGDKLVSTFSGGMKHRASLACSLMHEPEVLFLDEPTVGIDPELRANFWQHFKGLSAKGVTVIITTHYLDESRHCDDVAFLLRGKVVAKGTPGELLRTTGTSNMEDAFLALARASGVKRGD